MASHCLLKFVTTSPNDKQKTSFKYRDYRILLVNSPPKNLFTRP